MKVIETSKREKGERIPVVDVVIAVVVLVVTVFVGFVVGSMISIVIIIMIYADGGILCAKTSG